MEPHRWLDLDVRHDDHPRHVRRRGLARPVHRAVPAPGRGEGRGVRGGGAARRGDPGLGGSPVRARNHGPARCLD